MESPCPTSYRKIVVTVTFSRTVSEIRSKGRKSSNLPTGVEFNTPLGVKLHRSNINTTLYWGLQTRCSKFCSRTLAVFAVCMLTPNNNKKMMTKKRSAPSLPCLVIQIGNITISVVSMTYSWAACTRPLRHSGTIRCGRESHAGWWRSCTHLLSGCLAYQPSVRAHTRAVMPSAPAPSIAALKKNKMH